MTPSILHCLQEDKPRRLCLPQRAEGRFFEVPTCSGEIRGAFPADEDELAGDNPRQFADLENALGRVAIHRGGSGVKVQRFRDGPSNWEAKIVTCSPRSAKQCTCGPCLDGCRCPFLSPAWPRMAHTRESLSSVARPPPIPATTVLSTRRSDRATNAQRSSQSNPSQKSVDGFHQRQVAWIERGPARQTVTPCPGFPHSFKPRHMKERAPGKNSARLSSTHPQPTPRMDSKTSTEECPAPVEAKEAIIPRIPQDIIDEILDHHAAADRFFRFRSLRSCALVSRSWVQSCRRHLFRTVVFNCWAVNRWLKAFPVPGESPANHVRELTVDIGGDECVPEGFFEYTSLFTNTKCVRLRGFGGVPPLRDPSLWGLSRSVTSLTVFTDAVTLVQIRDIMAQLPDLDDLRLSGYPTAVDKDMLSGIGTTLKGRFGGRLVLAERYVDEDVTNMLLEIPTRLHFTEVIISGLHGCFPSTVRLAEACGKTLVDLWYEAHIYGKSYPFSWSSRF